MRTLPFVYGAGVLTGAFVGALVGLVVGKCLAAPRRMPLAAAWQQAVARRHGASQAAQLIARVEARYQALYAERRHYTNRAMRRHLEARILPILALYQVLRQVHSDQNAALAEVDELFHAAFARRRKHVAMLRWLPDPFPVFRWADRRIMQHSYPSEGWTIEWVADDDQRLAFNIRRCFYLDTLVAYGAPELMPHICGFDDWMFEALPPSIAWERTKTLGRGDDRCDFCWHRIAPASARRNAVEGVGG